MAEKQKISDDEHLIAGTLSDLIERLCSFEAKYKVAEARDSIVCQKSGLGEYKCTVRVPFGTRWNCDLCLEHELFELWKAGVHTVSSCCGHGRVPPYIQVLHGESVQKMHELKYALMDNVACPNNPNPCFRTKTFLPCFAPLGEHHSVHINADVQPVARGEWVVSCEPGDMYPHMNCSVCNFYWREIGHRKYFKFCPNCGADMRGDKE